MGDIGKRLTAPATLILLALIVSVILVPVAASAHHKDGHQTGKGQSSGSSTVPVPTAGTGDHDGDADLDPVTTIEDSHEEEVGVDDNRHPSGKDRSAEHGGSGNQGKSESAPDDNVGPMRNECGASPASDPRGGCTDKPGGSGGMDLHDQDGNNGCGNDDDFDDDNNGHCGGKAKDRGAPPAPTSPPPAKPETPPSKPETPPTNPPGKNPEGPKVKPPIVEPVPDTPGEPRVKRRQITSEEPPVRVDNRGPAPVPAAQLPYTGPEDTLAFVMFGFALLLLGGGMVQLVSVRPTL
ncbi:MAG TPA: LPXTG cell wall anchor domain-containing protein [Actinomycetota bacterium]|nr:LPXTG cell wall anchor domain-containing protein [Actinomycetota bacterium]